MRMRDDQREKEIHMTHMIGKAAATCAVAGLLVLGGVMPSQG
jgi:hypothetical protein